VNRFLCHSPEGASHLLCHFTAGALTQFAAAGAQYDSCLPNYFESSFPTVARDTVRQVSIGALVQSLFWDDLDMSELQKKTDPT